MGDETTQTHLKKIKEYAVVVLAAGLGGMIAKYYFFVSLLATILGGLPLLYLFLIDTKSKNTKGVLACAILLSVLALVGAYRWERISPITKTLSLYEISRYGWNKNGAVNLTINPILTPQKKDIKERAHQLEFGIKHNVRGAALYDATLWLQVPDEIKPAFHMSGWSREDTNAEDGFSSYGLRIDSVKYGPPNPVSNAFVFEFPGEKEYEIYYKIEGVDDRQRIVKTAGQKLTVDFR